MIIFRTSSYASTDLKYSLISVHDEAEDEEKW